MQRKNLEKKILDSINGSELQTVTEISDKIGENKATTYRYLMILAGKGELNWILKSKLLLFFKAKNIAMTQEEIKS